MTYEPDPRTWPARIAQYADRIRSRLSEPGTVFERADFLVELLEEIGLPPDVHDLNRAGEDATVRYGEIQHLLSEALHDLEHRGEIWDLGGGGNAHVSTLYRALGWEGGEPNAIQRCRGTNRLLTKALTPWVTLGTLWPNVDRLAEQAWEAWQDGLDVAGAVTARVAVEEAIRRGLEEVKATESWEDMKAAAREKLLFESYLTPKRALRFDPLDREATRSALSALRSLGNDAAHDGSVPSDLLQDSLTRLLPQALMSLSAALGAYKP